MNSKRIAMGVAGGIMTVSGLAGCGSPYKQDMIGACPENWPATAPEAVRPIVNTQLGFEALRGGVAELVADTVDTGLAAGTIRSGVAASNPAVSTLFGDNKWELGYKTTNGDSVDKLGTAFCSTSSEGQTGIYPSPLATQVVAELAISGIKVDFVPAETAGGPSALPTISTAP